MQRPALKLTPPNPTASISAAVQFNKVYPAPPAAMASISFSAAPDKRYSLGRMNTVHHELRVREISPAEDLNALTALIRAAYAPLAAEGLRYWATHQSAQDTAKRLSRGIVFVGELDGEPIATIALSRPDPESKVPPLRDPTTWSFGQFAVDPAHKGRGFGKFIHDSALARANREGCRVMALHTAAPAVALIAMYRAWGYQQVGTCDWRPHTNYLSVLMSKALPPLGAEEHAA